MIRAVLIDSQGLLLTYKAESGTHYKRPSFICNDACHSGLPFEKQLVPPSIGSEVFSLPMVLSVSVPSAQCMA